MFSVFIFFGRIKFEFFFVEVLLFFRIFELLLIILLCFWFCNLMFCLLILFFGIMLELFRVDVKCFGKYDGGLFFKLYLDKIVEMGNSLFLVLLNFFLNFF